MLCKNSCQFDWIGRGDTVLYKDMGKSEYSLTAQMVALKWGIPYLNKQDGYIGQLRFDRTYCKKPILRAIGDGTITINVWDRTDDNYFTEGQYYEIPRDGLKTKEAAVVQFRRSRFLEGDFLSKGKDRFFVSMSGIDPDFDPLDPPNSKITHDDFYQCFKNVGLATMAHDNLGFEEADYSKCYLFQRYGQTPDWDEAPQPTTTSTTSTTTTTTTTATPIAPPNWEDKGAHLPNQMSCQNFLQPASAGETLKGKPSPKIFGGSGAPRETYRWQVPLFDNQNNFICSGALLTKNQGAGADWVLTSAQCCEGRNTIIAKLGDFHLDSIDNGETTITSNSMFIHDDFQQFGEWSGNDACLINLGRVTASQSTIYEPVCISNDMPNDGAMCYVSGWGSLKALSGTLNNLHASPINYFPHNYCASIGYGNIKTSTEFCAGVPDSMFDATRDICNGDVGSPLVCEIAGKPVLSGLFSWGTSGKTSQLFWSFLKFRLCRTESTICFHERFCSCPLDPRYN